ncbi:FAD NAD(P)-binding domain-containing protein [Fusarium heterosporum]|uniref:FAD NAD(P)-binding domain-containing protein n=1 Tax=Fusarium heterosporum TaxID=42747 RepID=A0A8H5WEF3_FUSHE|nr:FAD NAD(P)-binding domain-containing protein [Fusarium heterosporum]
MTVKLFSSILVLASLANVGASKLESPVCIIGAGVSGLTAAKALEDKGYNTVIFEQRNTVGGKCQSHYEDGQYFPLGAVLFTQTSSYAETFKLVKSSGAAFDTFDPALAYNYNPKTGAAALMDPSSPAVIQALQEELARYAGVWQNEFAPIGVPGYRCENGVPKQYTVPAKEWLLSNKFPIIASVINRGAGNYGYGDYTQIPALYFLQFFAPDIIASFIGTVQPYKTDFHDVFKRVSKTLKGPIHLGVKIDRISRNTQPTIQYRSKGRYSKIQLCSDIIIAFPPTSKALKESGLALSASERALFAEVGVNAYFSSAVRMKNLGENLTVSQELPDPLTPFKAEGQPVYLTPLHPESSIVNVYSADDPAHPSAARVKEHLIRDLSKINKDLENANAVSTRINTADIRAFSGEIDYFPHLGPEALADGWYKKFNKLQGEDHTYFTSGLNSFELVEYTIRAARELVASHF